MSRTAEINLALHPKQELALMSPANECLYGGAAGGGKSHLARIALIIWCSEVPGLMAYLFRRNYDDLKKNHMEGPCGLRATLAPWVDAKLVEITEKEVRFLFNGSKIFLCHADNEQDIWKYQGAEMHACIIEEATQFTDFMIRFLRSRVRAPGLKLPEKYKDVLPKLLLTANPGGIGHLAVKAAFIDPKPPYEIWDTPDDEGGMRRQYIPAKLEDNPSMDVFDPGYRKRLRGMGDKALARAMEDGDWNMVAGAFFGEWRPAKHVIRPFNIPKHWTRFRAFDWGSSRPFCCLWMAVSSGEMDELDKPCPLQRNAIVVYREWYGRKGPNEGLEMPSLEVAKGIKERSLDETYAYSVADPAIFASQDGPCIAENMSKGGVIFRPADNKRKPGWDQVRQRLSGEDDRPMLYVFDSCVDLIRTLPVIQRDKHDVEDCDSDQEDHALDTLRYGLCSRPYMRVVERPKPLQGVNTATFDQLRDAHNRLQSKQQGWR